MSTRNYIAAVAAVLALASGSVIVVAQQPSRAGQQQADVFRRLNADIVAFRASLDRALTNGSRNDSNRGGTDINKAMNDFTVATDRLRLPNGARNRQVSAADVTEVLKRASAIDGFMAVNTLDAAAERDWLTLRGDLDALAADYNLASNWTGPRDDGNRRRSAFDRRLTGTYELETSRGDDPARVVQQATRSLSSSEQQAASRRLLRRLNAPETIAIDRSANRITMASSRGRQVTFDADGQVQREQAAAGRTMTTRATLTGDQLMVTTTGSGGSDFAVTFAPIENGRNLEVTRSIRDDRLRQPVTVHSFYRKTSDDARWDIDLTDEGTPAWTDRSAGDFDMPGGTRLVATLDKPLSTRSTTAEDRFTMTTRTPSEYEGAVIEGTVSSVNTSGRVAGRADMALNFERIRLRNGRTYPFGGTIESVRNVKGEAIRVDNEGKVGDGSQTEKTVQVGAIGAALGAIIGAMSGGGKGAAIGAAIGAAGGAGTVIAQGRDQLDLVDGTEFTIISSIRDGQRTSAGRER